MPMSIMIGYVYNIYKHLRESVICYHKLGQISPDDKMEWAGSRVSSANCAQQAEDDSCL